ncbi:MAG TPA: phage major capsid protein [Terracidiphilus sp.]|jgi:HK97 family phage major capsid protein|nr:phage major capsid protein [Terracidiphilus sp.]
MDLQQLKFNRNKLLTDMSTIAGKPWSTESRAQFDQMNVDVTNLESDIQRAETLASLNAKDQQFTRSPRPQVNGSTTDETSVEYRKKNFSEAFRQYALHGRAGLNQEQRDLLTTSAATGGALIPQLFNDSLTMARKFYGPIADKVKQKITDKNGAPVKISLGNDTTHGLTLLGTEGTSSPAETDPSFQANILGVDTVTGGLVKVSFEELEDSAFDLDAFLRESFGMRYARGLEKAITVGTDSAGTPLPNQTAGGISAGATVVVTTVAIAEGLGWDDLTAAYTGLDPAYVQNASWVMNSTTRGYLVGLKDGFGRPYFQPDPSDNAPFSRILGFPIVLNQSMPAMGASAIPIIFGSLADAYMLRTDGQPSILRLNERFADTLEVGFYMWTRIGGISLNAGVTPLVSIQQASS